MVALQPSAEIIAWAQRQPKWRQDALRRLIQGGFTEEDENEVLSILKYELGILNTAPEVKPLTMDHLPSYGSNMGV
jgi:hypothetical protein